jgi:hypothetical protein
MSQTNRHLLHHLGNGIALSQQVASAIELEIGSSLVVRDEVRALLEGIRETLEGHISEMNGLLSELGGNLDQSVKNEVAAATGFVNGLYARFRGESQSRLLTAHHVALSTSAATYTILHATGLALGEDAVADLAERHLAANREMLVDISRVLPEVVIQELEDDGQSVDSGAADVTARAVESALRGKASSSSA